jgi:mono/diheme cytochrome c family protein
MDRTIIPGAFRMAAAVLLALAGALPLGAGDVPAEPAVDAKTAAFFEQQVRPVLKESCFKCHGGEAKIKGGLRLTARDGVLAGGDTGPAVDLKNPDASLLLKMIRWTDDDHQMPPKTKLAPDKIAILTAWVKQGAPWSGPQGPTAEELAAAAKKADAEARDYWFYQPLAKSAVPKPADAQWSAPIDAFVRARLDAKGIKPAAEADRRTLIRRATYDLIGLPPTPAEVEAFAKDPDPQAYDKLLDRLLASPQYGEKWGRYWLDLVRFAETNGYERDGDKPNAWRYRDYVIKAFNEDKPYDQFVREQLAGDLFDKPTPDSITATGYYRLGTWDDEPADQEQNQYDYFDGIVSTTAQGMLGLSMGCARCHDHKKDPLSQEDYYRFLAFFHSIKPHAKNGPNLETVIAHDDSQRAAWDGAVKALQARLDATEADFRQKAGSAAARDFEDLSYRYYRGAWETLPAFDELKAESEGKLPGGLIDTAPTTRDSDYGFVYTGTLVVPKDGAYTFALDSDDGSRLIVDGHQVVLYDGIHGVGSPQQGKATLKKGRVPLRLEYFQHVGGRGLTLSWAGPGVDGRSLTRDGAARDKAEAGLADQINARGQEVLGKEAFAAYRKDRRDLERLKKDPPGDQSALSAVEGDTRETFVLARGNPHSPTKKVAPGFPHILGVPDPQDGPKRRLALADWIASPTNQLSSRVIVNRLWQFHFGKGIVSTANDFGHFGELPSDPALLDWLAADFVANGWRIKRFHKQLMTSRTYRLSSRDDAQALAKDPQNDLHWRFSMRRLTAEEIRDSILAIDGTLNPSMGGPSIFPPMPEEVLATSSRPHEAWGHSPPDEAARRSVYIKVKRSLLYPLLAAHDFADTDTTCPVRFATTVPTQALTMLNSSLMAEQSAAFARRLRKEAGEDPAKQVRLALALATQREPTEREVGRGTGFLHDLQQQDKLTDQHALETFCLMVLNLNEFVYLD